MANQRKQLGIRSIVLALIFSLACLALPTTALALNSNGSVRNASSAEQDAGFWNTYGIPSSEMSITANSGITTENELSKAFDRNLGTRWKSYQANNVNCTLGGVNYTNFHNYIDVVFSQQVCLDSFLYAAANEADGKGYPTKMRVWYDDDAEGEFTDYIDFNSANSTALKYFDFAKQLNVKRLRLEWLQVPTYHYYNATAAEIIFLQPRNADIDGLFADFSRTTLSSGYDQAKIDSMRSQLSGNINYTSQFKPLLDRAQQILDGVISFDESRLYTTNTQAYGGQQLQQYGNRRSYSGNVLRNSWFGIDKQSLGLAGVAGQSITVYVDAPDGTPLPSINFTQYFGSWRSWQSMVQLKKGVNVINVPSYALNYCTWPVQQQGGGPFYLSNPYLPSQQQGDIRIYIEGGLSYPVYHQGEDEAAFYQELSKYAAKFSIYGSATQERYFQSGVGFNLCEMEGDHVLITVPATNSYNVLIGGSKSVKTSMDNWDVLMEELFEYDGIPTSPDSPYYQYWDERIEHLGINIRIAQPYGAAYGAYQQVGIFYDDWIAGAIYCDGKEGWGMIHEIGHTMDMNDRIVSECSNNMYSKLFESIHFSDGSRGDFNQDLAALSDDRKDYSLSSRFDQNRLNFLIWFRLEAMHPGFWGEIGNLYRYDCAAANGLNSTEKHIYLASRVMGIDLRYYYERYGYHQASSDAVFSRASQSAKLNSLMQGLLDSGAISSDQPRYWYVDTQQYRLNSSGQLTAGGIYDSGDKPSIKSIEKSSAGYSILIGAVDSATGSAGANSKDHLGYEILEHGTVIGFTWGSSFSDSSSYTPDYQPVYSVRAVDRALNASAQSDPKSVPSASDSVCRLERGGTSTSYNSIAAAIEAAQNGDSLVLLQNHTETGLILSKSIEIKGDPNAQEALVWSKGSSGILLKISGNAKVTIDGSKLILDGNGFQQAGSLIYVESGSLTANGLVMRNNLIASGNDSYGGAIRGVGGTINLNGCTITGCQARYGGAVALSTAKCTLNMLGGSIQGNSAYDNGGGLCITGAAYLSKGAKVQDNSAKLSGGGIYVYSGGILCCNTDFAMKTVHADGQDTVTISGNSARDGGGICQDGNTKIYNTLLEGNHATANGGGIYSMASSGSHRAIYSYSGTIIRDNSAANTGSAVYSKAAAGAGPVLRDTEISGYCNAGRSLLHQESGTAGVIGMTGNSSCTMKHAGPFHQMSEIGASCSSNGTKAHVICTSCTALLANEDSTVVLSAADLTIPKLEHAYAGEWHSDASGHWQLCQNGDCTEKGPLHKHVESADGSCSVCGHGTHVHALSKVAAVAADCIHAGNSEYYRCNCGLWFEDEQGQDVISDHSSVIIAAKNHSFSTNWSTGDDSGHRHECTACGAYESVQAHVYDNGLDLDCNICGFVRPHTHSLGKVSGSAASCTEDGMVEHWECDICNTWFSSNTSNGQSENIDEISDHSSVRIPALGHDFSGSWNSDAAAHWHVCGRDSCGAVEAGSGHVLSGNAGDCTCSLCGRAHCVELEYVAEVPASCTEAGVRAHYLCSCGACFFDSAGSQSASASQLEIPCIEHSWSENYLCNASEHWKICTVCKCAGTSSLHQPKSLADHSCSSCGYELPHNMKRVLQQAASCLQTGLLEHWECIDCGKLYSDAAGNEETSLERLEIPLADHEEANDGSHSCQVCKKSFAQHVDGVAAACETEGLLEHYVCSNCGDIFLNADGSGPIGDEAELIIPATQHDFSEGWQSDDAGHWMLCKNCGAYAGATKDMPVNIDAHHDDGSGHCASCGHEIIKNANSISLSPAGDQNLVYGESFVLPQAAATYGIPNVSMSKEGQAVSAVEDAGSYLITWTVAESPEYYGASCSITVSIGQAPNKLSLTNSSDITVTAGQQIELPQASADFGTPQMSIIKEGSEVSSMLEAGLYNVNWFVPACTNYQGASASITVQVQEAQQQDPDADKSQKQQEKVINSVNAVPAIEVSPDADNSQKQQEKLITSVNTNSNNVQYPADEPLSNGAESDSLQAASDNGASKSKLPMILAAAAAILLAGGLILIIAKRRRKRD